MHANKHKNIVVGALLIVVVIAAIAMASFLVHKAKQEDITTTDRVGMSSVTSTSIIIGLLSTILALIIAVMATNAGHRKDMGIGITINLILLIIFIFVILDQFPRLQKIDDRDGDKTGATVMYIEIGIISAMMALSLGLITYKLDVPNRQK
jgi:membrane protease YdiL (CAAX protease family)